jgi:class 3 adenylate cyclase
VARKKYPLYKRVLHLFYKQNKLISQQENIREVYFGLRVKFLGLFTLVMAVIIAVLTLIMYLNNRQLILKEKYTKARSLTRILSGPAEFYLDKNIDTTKGELETKYQIIQRESQNFTAYNDDISKIVLTDETGRVVFSTSKWDYGRMAGIPNLKEALQQKEEKLLSHDFTVEVKDKKTRKINSTNYHVITYPIFLHKGNAVNILDDFNRLFLEYHGADKRRKNQIYLYLWKKYGNVLDKDFDTANHKKEKEKEKPEKVTKANDADFLFLSLFNYCMTYQKKGISGKERWLWNDRWLYTEKEKKNRAYLEDNPTKAKEIDDLIVSRITRLSERVESVRKLGVLAVVFNVDIFKKVSKRDTQQIIIIALIMMAVTCIAFFIVLSFTIKNLKKLERWAISISKGNLDEKIEIVSNDEIGRLGDISNYMIDEIKLKYHLEKFVSRSTKNMINGKKAVAGEIDLGAVGRKNLAFLCSDIRGFTSFSEKNDPGTVIEVLNLYFEFQSNIIKGYKGDIDDYVGDQIMAHFSGEKRAERAADTAVKIMSEIEHLNVERKRSGLPVFEVGIGIHDGDVVVGNVGSKFRMDFACIGDAVNLTSRLCSAAKAGEILISRHLIKQTKKKYHLETIPPLELKGKEKKVQVVKINY